MQTWPNLKVLLLYLFIDLLKLQKMQNFCTTFLFYFWWNWNGVEFRKSVEEHKARSYNTCQTGNWSIFVASIEKGKVFTSFLIITAVLPFFLIDHQVVVWILCWASRLCWMKVGFWFYIWFLSFLWSQNVNWK